MTNMGASTLCCGATSLVTSPTGSRMCHVTLLYGVCTNTSCDAAPDLDHLYSSCDHVLVGEKSVRFMSII